MDNQISQSYSLPVSPIPNENDINASSSLPTPGLEHIVLEKLMETKGENVEMKIQMAQMKLKMTQIELENIKLKEELEKKEHSEATSNAELIETLKKKDEYIKESEAASNAQISKLTIKVQALQMLLDSMLNRIKQIQPMMWTVADLILDGEIVYELSKYATLMIRELEYNSEKWLADGIEISPGNPDLQICVTNKFIVKNNIPDKMLDLSPMVSCIFCSNITELILDNTTMTYSEYKQLVSSPNLEDFKLMQSNIIDESGNQMEAADSLKEVPQSVTAVTICFKDNEITSETAQNISQLHFSKLQRLYLYNIKKTFDLQAFAEFVKQHPNTFITLEYGCSPACFAKIQDIEKELRPTLPSDCKLTIKEFYNKA